MESIPQVKDNSEVTCINAEEALRILSEYAYEHQRSVLVGKLAQYAKDMRNGDWAGTTTIDIAVFDGKRFLINGQHRLQAVVMSEKPQTFCILYRHFSTYEAIWHAYFNMDAGNMRNAGDSHKMLIEPIGVARNWMGRAAAALRMIDGDFFHSRGEDVLTRTQLNNKLLEWQEEIRLYAGTVGEPQSPAAKRLHSAPIMAVALVTLRHQKERACEFWSGVARNDGLRSGTPEHTLMMFMANYQVLQAGGQFPYARKVALAWNAFYSRRGLTVIRLMDTTKPILILGTPYNGKVKEEASE